MGLWIEFSSFEHYERKILRNHTVEVNESILCITTEAELRVSAFAMTEYLFKKKKKKKKRQIHPKRKINIYHRKNSVWNYWVRYNSPTLPKENKTKNSRTPHLRSILKENESRYQSLLKTKNLLSWGLNTTRFTSKKYSRFQCDWQTFDSHKNDGYQ